MDEDAAGVAEKLAESPPNYAAAKQLYENKDGTAGRSLKATRRLQGFSANNGSFAGEQEYDRLVQYFGRTDYADAWITGALDKTNVDFPNLGDADFATVGDDATRVEAANKGIVCLSVWMFALHMLENAASRCVEGDAEANLDKRKAVGSVDKFMAFYTGARAGSDGSAKGGNFMYALADSLCAEFGTCNATAGTSRVNAKIVAELSTAQAKAAAGQCSLLRAHFDVITAQGSVVFIQGALSNARGDARGAATKAAAASFAAAILGRLHACSAADAAIVYANLRIGAPTTDATAVQEAFARNYGCMNITAADVEASSGLSTEALIAIIVGAGLVALLVLLALLFCSCRRSKQSGTSSSTKSTPPEPSEDI